MTRTFQDEMEELGEATVRERLVSRVWSDRKRDMAEAWLAERDRIAAISDIEEQRRIARSAKNAAWAAAIAAIIAAIAAVVSIVIALWPRE